MRIFFADREYLIRGGLLQQLGVPHLLLSFYYLGKTGGALLEEVVGMTTRSGAVDIFLDSGAFSAWSQGVTIDLDAYIAFVHQWKTHLSVYANLDVIGDPQASWENQKEMERQGLDPIPCYHVGRGEPVSWLKKYLEFYSYIALGGMGGRDHTVPQMARALDEVFSIICDPRGIPRVKVHGFAVTGEVLMLRYPWASVDSTTWVLTGRFGSCFVLLDGKIHKVGFSDKSPSVREAGKHFRTYTQMEQQEIQRYLDAKGFTAKELAEKYQKRDELNIIFFLDLEKNWQTRPFRREQVQPGFSLV